MVPPMLEHILEGMAAAAPANSLTADTIGVGLVMLVGQIVLTLFFTHVTKSGPWHAEPGFTAHQLVYFPLAVYTAYVGCVHWFGELPATPAARVLALNAAGLHLAQLSIAELVLWDIPTGFAVKALRDPIMVAHHVGFVITAYAVTQTCNSYYALMFFGVVEFSSVFLAFADVFHPKHAAYAAWLETAPALKAVNEVVRVCFVLSYMAVRGFYFPYVVWGCYVPDMLALLALPPSQRGGHTDAELWLPFFLGSAFSVLQLYWGFLLVKQLKKMLGEKPKAKAA